MSESKRNWINIGIGAFIIIAILLLIALILPLSNLAVETDEIAIIPISGTIVYGDSNSSKIHTSNIELESQLNDAIANPNVKAIVLDINSKGGSLVASDEICSLIKNSSKPVVSYIGDKGLDEAYLIATSSDYIVASPSSTIGAIGLSYINSDKYSVEKLSGVYNEKYLKTNNSKNRDVSNLANAQKMVDQDYTQFIKRIAKNRDLKPNYVAELAHGKKYNGNEAKNLGLIDKIGSKNTAVKKAAKMANTTNYTTTTYPKSNERLTEFLGENNIFGIQDLIKI